MDRLKKCPGYEQGGFSEEQIGMLCKVADHQILYPEKKKKKKKNEDWQNQRAWEKSTINLIKKTQYVKLWMFIRWFEVYISYVFTRHVNKMAIHCGSFSFWSTLQ